MTDINLLTIPTNPASLLSNLTDNLSANRTSLSYDALNLEYQRALDMVALRDEQIAELKRDQAIHLKNGQRQEVRFE